MSSLMLVRINSFSDTTRFRGEGIDVSTGSPVSVKMSPCSYGFTLPEVGALVYCLDGKSTVKEMIGVMGDPSVGSSAGLELGDKLAVPSNLLDINQGDAFIGSRSRGYFSESAFLYSNNFRSKLMLSDSGLLDAKGFNWSIKTEDNLVGVYTSSENKYGFGDSLSVLRASEASGVTKMVFAKDGSVDLLARSGVATPSRVSLSANGDVSLFSGAQDASAPSSLVMKGDGSTLTVTSGEVGIKGGKVTITGETRVAGATTLAGAVTVNGALSATSGVTLGGKVDLGGTVLPGGTMVPAVTFFKMPVYISGVLYNIVVVL